jgi:hypothetical protein
MESGKHLFFFSFFNFFLGPWVGRADELPLGSVPFATHTFVQKRS